MFIGTFAHQDDFEGWRDLARQALKEGRLPDEVQWAIEAPDDLFTCQDRQTQLVTTPLIKIPRRLYLLMQAAFQSDAPTRLSKLYALLHALAQHDERRVASLSSEVETMAKLAHENIATFRRDFRLATLQDLNTHARAMDDPESVMGFKRIYAGQALILTRLMTKPWRLNSRNLTIRWSGRSIYFSRGDAGDGTQSGRREVRAGSGYWANLPQLRLPAERLIRPDSSDHTARPLQNPAMSCKSAPDRAAIWAELASVAIDCTACDLCQLGGWVVFGEGQLDAKLMLIGEQPGDQEDLQGRPFVGPAGALLDRSLQEAGLERQKLYVTNAVKHFRYYRRNMRRIHQKPDAIHIRTCHTWLSQEIALVSPRRILLLGASAASAVLGRPVTVGRERSRFFQLSGSEAMITVHPSYLLRIPDPELRERETKRFLADLRMAAEGL